MNDVIVVVLLIVGVGLVLAIASGQSPAQYARGEWRRMWQDSWAPGAEKAEPPPEPFTSEDPRVAATVARMRYARTKMERLGIKPLMRLKGDPRARDVRAAWQRVVQMGRDAPAREDNVRALPRRAR
jgi:hypothetical protein